MPCIYLTTNLYNKANNILPFQYIGSDQHDKLNYFGSSKLLKEDLLKLGESSFKKEILMFFEKIDNISLRNLESQIQIEYDCAKNPIFYNRTNKSFKGFFETEEEKFIRLQKCRNAHKKWNEYLKTLPKEEQIKRRNIPTGNKNIWSKTNFENWKEKFGEDEALKRKEKWKQNLCGENNGMSKYSDKQKKQAIELFLNGYSRNQISEITKISYGIVKVIIRNYNCSVVELVNIPNCLLGEDKEKIN